jgi:hypothetical protein
MKKLLARIYDGVRSLFATREKVYKGCGMAD